MAKVQFKYGTWAKYSALSQKDENTLYFITDKNLFFKGSSPFGNVVGAVATGSGETEGKTITFNAADGTEVSFTVPTAAALAAVKSALAGSLTTHTNVKGTSSVFGHVKLSDSTDSTSAASAHIAATPKAVKDALAAAKSYADGILAANDAMVFKGTLGDSASNATVTALPTTYQAGWTYKVVAKGTYAGKVCEVGDLIIAVKDSTSSSVSSNDDWCVVQANIDGAVTAASTLTADSVVLGAGNKSAKVLANGSNGQVLTIGADGKPEWGDLPTEVSVDNIEGILPLEHGGTGASDAAGARTNLGLGTAATKASTTSVQQNDGGLPTAGAVYTAIQDALPEWVELA